MKKERALLAICIITLIILNIFSNITNAAGENYKARTYIDTPSEGSMQTVSGTMTVKGWYMSDDAQAQLKIYINDKVQEIKSIKRETRQDVINGVKGFGTITENPTPGYNAQIDLSNIKTGIYNLKTEIVSRTGIVLATDTRTIKVQGIYKAKTYIDNPAEGALPTAKEKFTVKGWYMSNDVQSTLNIYIDGKKQEISSLIREKRQDVINAIKGFGTAEENPAPGYSAQIDISTIKNGIHTIKTEIVSKTGEVLATNIRSINIQNYKAKMYVESPKEYTTTSVKGTEMQIDGWLMTDDVNSQIKVYIDGKLQEVVETKRHIREDVIKAIKGFGTKEQNPTPGYSLKLDLSKTNDGTHSIKVDIVSRAGEVLASNTRNINLKKYNAKTYVESPKEYTTTSVAGTEMQIDGWLMTDDANSQIKVYVDGKLQQIVETKRHIREDVIKAIKGFGTKEQNPTPGYSLKINLSSLKDGIHNIKVDIVSTNGEVLSSNTRTISLKKYDAKMCIENPVMWQKTKPEITVAGWVMSTDENSSINVYIDGIKQNILDFKRHERTDVIKAIKGFGGVEKNPTPGFEFKINAFNLSVGNHTLLVEVRAQDGKVLASETKYIVAEKYKAKMCVETPAEWRETENKTGEIQIDGWLMTDDVNTQIKIYINGKEQKINETLRHEREDVIKAIKGFGTKEQNPTPGYSLKIDMSTMRDGRYTLRVDVVSRTGEVIASDSRAIYLNKYEAKMYLELPVIMGQAKKVLTVGGWIMSTDEQLKLNVYINNQKQNNTTLTRFERNDVLGAIKGFGGASKNPKPGYETEVDVSRYNDGKYELKVELVSREGEIMASEQRTIVIYNKYDIGIDVSKHNGDIDWTKIKQQGISFAIIRAGYRGYGEAGTLVKDNKFVQNMRGAIDNGIEVGVYFYSQALNEAEAIEEAELTLKQIRDNGFGSDITLPIVIDTEASGGRGDTMTPEQRTAVVKAFCTRIQQAGYKAMIYSNVDWLKNNIILSSLSEYDIWMAHYTGTFDPVNNPSSYKGKYQIWQYTSVGQLVGINHDVDMNISYKKYFK